MNSRVQQESHPPIFGVTARIAARSWTAVTESEKSPLWLRLGQNSERLTCCPLLCPNSKAATPLRSVAAVQDTCAPIQRATGSSSPCIAKQQAGVGSISILPLWWGERPREPARRSLAPLQLIHDAGLCFYDSFKILAWFFREIAHIRTETL